MSVEKKTAVWAVTVWAAVVLAGAAAVWAAIRHPVRAASVSAGQVWVYTAFKGSPWDEYTRTNTVLEVRDGWVRYSTRYPGGDRDHEKTDKTSWFVMGSKRIK